jgi:hypothetical protein
MYKLSISKLYALVLPSRDHFNHGGSLESTYYTKAWGEIIGKKARKGRGAVVDPSAVGNSSPRL